MPTAKGRSRLIAPVLKTAITIYRNPGLFMTDLGRLLGMRRESLIAHIRELSACNIITRDLGKRNYISPHAMEWVKNIAEMPDFPKPPPHPTTVKQGTYVYTDRELSQIKRHRGRPKLYK